jgi:hypothetical protein
MFFTTEWHFPLGAHMRFTLVLQHADRAGEQEVSCAGVVVRIEPGTSVQGVAVNFSSYDVGAFPIP